MTRLEYINSLIDSGLTTEEIEEKLQEWDLENAAETDDSSNQNFQTGVANVGANEAPQNQAPIDTESASDPGLSESPPTMPSRGQILTGQQPKGIDDLDYDEARALLSKLSYKDRSRFTRQRSQKYSGNSRDLYDKELMTADIKEFIKNKELEDPKDVESANYHIDNMFSRINNLTEDDYDAVNDMDIDRYFGFNEEIGYLSRDAKLDINGKDRQEHLNRVKKIREYYNSKLREGYTPKEIQEDPEFKRLRENKDTRFTSDQQHDDYLKNVHFKNDPEKYKEYKKYKEDGSLPNNQDFKNISYENQNMYKYNLLEKMMRGVDDEDVQNQIQKNIWNKTNFKNKESALNYLEDKSEDSVFQFLKDQEKAIYDEKDEYEKAIKPYQDKINTINQKIASYLDERGNLKNPEDIDKIEELVKEQQDIYGIVDEKGLIKMYDNIIQNANNHTIMLNQWRQNVKDVENASLFEAAAAKDYSFTTRAAIALEDFFVGDIYHNFTALLREGAMRMSGQGIAAAFMGDAGKALLDKEAAVIWEAAIDYNKKMDAKRKAVLPQDLKLADIGENNVDFADWFGEAIANNSPSILTGFIPGGGGLYAGAIKSGFAKLAAKKGTEAAIKKYGTRAAVLQKAKNARIYTANTAGSMFFLTESGSKIGDLQQHQKFAISELDLTKEDNIYNKLDKLKPGTIEHRLMEEEIRNLEHVADYNFAQKAFTSYAYGTTAALFERFGSMKWVQDASEAAMRVGYNEFKGNVYRSLPNFTKTMTFNTAKGVLPILGKGMTIEQFEELGTQLSHNFFDITVLGEKQSMLEGIDADFFANNAVTILGIGTPSAGVNVVNSVKNEFRLREEALRNSRNAQELDQINMDLKKLTGDKRKEALKRRRQLFKELALADFYSVTKLNRLKDKPGNILAAADAATEAREALRSGESLGRGMGINESDQKTKKELQDRYRKAKAAMEEDNALGAIKVRNQKELNEYKEKLGIQDDKDIDVDLMYDYGLYHAFSDAAQAMLPKDGRYIVIKDPKNMVKELQDQGLTEAEIAEVQSKLQKKINGKDILTILQARGTILGNNTIVINEQAVVESLFKANKLGLASIEESRYAAAAPLEELFHLRNIGANIVDKKGRLNKAGVKAVKDARKAFEKKFKAGLLPKISKKEYQALINRFKLYEGKKKYARTDYEEIMAQMNNAALLGVLKPSDLIENPSIGNYVRDLVSNVMGDAFFMYELNSADNVFRFIRQFERSVKSVAQVQLAPEEEDEITKQQKAFEVNKIPVDNIFNTTEGVKGIDKDRNKKAFDEAFELGLLDNAINTEFRKVQGLPGVDNKATEDFKQGMYEELLAHALNYDSNIGYGFFGWLMRAKRFKGLNVVKKKNVPIKPKFEADITDPVFGNMVATDVNTFDLSEIMEDVATYVEVTLDDKGNVKLTSDLFDDTVLQEIQNVTAREITVAKNQIYQDYSKNKKVNPFVGELKKSLQKQADIIVRKAMGKMSDKSYETFLKKHKQTILNNSTKTYLSKFLPEAVLKSVGGRKVIEDGKVVGFIPNYVPHSVWGEKGVKIDKEIAAVHGRTAQHQIMKKDPNFEISDQDWINIFIKNGKALGMKKESIAKQIAFKVGFDMFRGQAQLNKGKLLDAFKINMELKDVLLKENYVAELGMQLDMGEFEKQNKAFSDEAVARLPQGIMGQTFTDTILDLMNLVDKDYNGIVDKVIDENGNFKNQDLNKLYPAWAPIFAKEIMDIGVYQNTGFINMLRRLGVDKGLITDFLNTINIGSKKHKGITTNEREAIAKKNLEVVAPALAPILDVIGVEILGYDARVLDPAASKVDKKATLEARKKAKENNLPRPKRILVTDKNGKIVTGSYFNNYNNVKSAVAENKGNVYVPSFVKEEDKKAYVAKIEDAIKDVVLYNSQSGRMKEINEDIYSVEGVDNQKAKAATYAEEINKSNRANTIVLNHVVETLRDLYQNGKIDANYLLGVLQAQTNIKDGFRGISTWNLLHLDGKKRSPKDLQGNNNFARAYGEHLLANVVMMGHIAKTVMQPGDIDVAAEMQDAMIGFTQLTTFADYTKQLDKDLGRANPELNIDRINKMGKAAINNIFTFDGVPFREYRAKQMSVKTFDKKLKKARIFDKAFEKLNKPFAEDRGITVLDFDDTLAFSESNVIVNMPDGTTKTITPAQFATDAAELERLGATFDFSEFNDVKKGRKGPMFDLALKRQQKFGNKDIYVLTARPQASARAIQKFAQKLGLYIPYKNITGLEDGRPEAKADWIAGKVAEGYNNFYFADDAIKNVKAVKDILEKLKVRNDVQVAKYSKAFDPSVRFNEILEEVKGVAKDATYSDAAAKMRGRKKKEGFFMPYSAEDFEGLMYSFMGKGKQGEEHMKFFEDFLFKPFARGHDAMNRQKQVMQNDYKALKKSMPDVHAKLRKDSGYNDFTYDQAVRVYIWNKIGVDIPGLSKRDTKALTDIVKKDADMTTFADTLMKITKAENNWAPTESWLASTIGLDMQDINHTVKRSEYLAEWINNKNKIFSKDNLNKIEAIYGTDFREALEDILYRMENGTNRNFGQNKFVNNFMDWINGSVGVVMFFNTRSAVLQSISFANFVNWTDNNMLAAGKAFANQPQFWEDFSTLFNSDFLKQRRSGLRQDINWQEIADHVKKSKNKTKAAIHWMLQKGFLPTQMMDSFAIALGGASFFRNRINSYKQQGLSQEEAEAKAFVDFQEIAEKTQQSSRPDLISQQQASPIGRVILAFQNVTMQYNRQGIKAVKDLINRRGDDKTNLSKAVYYFGLQNLLFNSLQQALFAMIFDDETPEEEQDKYFRIGNGMVDSILRGMGYKAAILATLKNMAIKFKEQSDKPANRADYAQVLIEGINLSPPMGSKARRFYQAFQNYKFNYDEMVDKGLLDVTNPAYEAMANLISVATNAPTDRAYHKVNSLKQVMNSELESWQRIFIAFGWRDWQLGVENERPGKKRTIINAPIGNNNYKPIEFKRK
tara:strand:- start:155 stop:9103 length:8949 start_codon:yes stop_codon:yes gene_type:complete